MINHSVPTTLTNRGQESTKPSADPPNLQQTHGMLLAMPAASDPHALAGDVKDIATASGRLRKSIYGLPRSALLAAWRGATNTRRQDSE